MEYMVISVQDENSVDLVTHFVECFDFIDRGRAAGEQPCLCSCLRIAVLSCNLLHPLSEALLFGLGICRGPETQLNVNSSI